MTGIYKIKSMLKFVRLEESLMKLLKFATDTLA
ncbi:MAG: hypothetical protein JWO92_394 [Chitinophagaceae bacterium]|nr:hypothetical protein [Chitinophagaceae bacterium]MDB5222396.1 hypothetical protein [Chitinophagaceae bacterium]